MSRGNTVMYNAWGAVIDNGAIPANLKSEHRDNLPKSITSAYVSGPRIRIEETDLVSFLINVVTKSTLTTLYAKVQLSFDGDTWRDMSAGLALTAVGVSPNQEIESEVLPLIRKFVISADADGFFMNYELRAVYCRLLLKGNATVAASRVEARCGI